MIEHAPDEARRVNISDDEREEGAVAAPSLSLIPLAL